MNEALTIKAVSNGFIVQPIHQPNCDVIPNSIAVFETYEAMFDDLKEHFGSFGEQKKEKVE